MPPLVCGMVVIFFGALSWREFVGTPGCDPVDFTGPLYGPLAELFNPSIAAGFAVLVVAMGTML